MKKTKQQEKIISQMFGLPLMDGGSIKNLMDGGIPDDLLRVYRSTIPEKLVQIKQLIENVKRQAGKQELEALRFALHKLAGNSGVYGYMQVSRLCKLAEAELDKALQNNDVRWLEKLDSFYKELERGFHGR